MLAVCSVVEEEGVMVDIVCGSGCLECGCELFLFFQFRYRDCRLLSQVSRWKDLCMMEYAG